MKQEPFTGMRVESWPLARLKPYERNPRKIPQAAIEKVAASIREYNFRQPIVVDRAGVIVAGHVRYLAAQHLGLAEVPVHVAADLTKEQLRAYRIADNRTNQEADWWPGLLALELHELETNGIDLALTALNPDEIEDILLPPEPPHMRRISVTAEQYAVIEQAAEKLRASEQDPDISLGRALELIAADALAG